MARDLNLYGLMYVLILSVSDVPSWASQFELGYSRSYYEGYVDDLSLVLEIYQHETVST